MYMPKNHNAALYLENKLYYSALKKQSIDNHAATIAGIVIT